MLTTNGSNGFIHKLPKATVIDSREDLILSYCRGKTVLHLGCVESQKATGNGASLHFKLLKVAKRVIGVDIDQEGMDLMNKKVVDDLVCCDVQALDQIRLDVPIDVIVAGEIIEHLANPGLCLSGIAQMMQENKSILIVTVPNAFSFRNFFSVLVAMKENVLADHNFYFSHTTIKGLLEKHSLRITDFYTYSNLRDEIKPFKRFTKRILNRTVFRLSPFSAEGLIAIAVKE